MRNKYAFFFINQQYMRLEIANHCRTEDAKKRKPTGTVISLDAETENSWLAIAVNLSLWRYAVKDWGNLDELLLWKRSRMCI